jgi:hypothetical protein
MSQRAGIPTGDEPHPNEVSRFIRLPVPVIGNEVVRDHLQDLGGKL